MGTEAKVEERDVEALKRALSQEAPPMLIDVRTPGEFSGGHVPGAVNVPLDTLHARIDSLSGAGAVWLVCRSGARSAKAARALAQAGISAVNVTGGTAAWRRGGHPLEPPAAAGGVPLGVPLVLSLTLGLAPFAPEPHVLGKLRWIAGGAVGMAPMDWLDLAFHGAPWLWLAWALLARFRGRTG